MKKFKQPHDNWAIYYDFVYERTFGNLYYDLTAETINVIKEIIKDGTIIDYGAGTGRLTIPLKNMNYDINDVEKSSGMVDILRSKAEEHKLEIPLYNCSISEYENGYCDLALCLFTVLSYATTENKLKKNIQNVCKHLKPKGYFFFDLPNLIFFKAERLININSNNFNRSVTLLADNKNKDVYTYHEKCNGKFKGQQFEYVDEFTIRYWELDFVENLLKLEGLRPIDKDFTQFNSTGSTYKLYQKI